MKIGRYVGAMGEERLGVVLENGASRQVLDLLTAFSARLGAHGWPTDMNGLIDAGGHGLELAYATIDWAAREGEAAWLSDEARITWSTPVAVRNCIATGRNFAQHVAEARAYWAERGVAEPHRDFPTGFTKLTSVLVPHRAAVRKPDDTQMLDYEVEAAAIIGRPIENATPVAARRAIWGYSVLNDLSARDWQRREMANQLLLLGKNFPGFGPFGPWILTADEVPDPSGLVVRLSVNGEERQRSGCDCMVHDFDHMVAHWSKLGLQRGDVVTSGTPQGVAIGFKPDPTPFFLKPGDVVHAEVEQVGILETRIV